MNSFHHEIVILFIDIFKASIILQCNSDKNYAIGVVFFLQASGTQRLYV